MYVHVDMHVLSYSARVATHACDNMSINYSTEYIINFNLLPRPMDI